MAFEHALVAETFQ